MKERPIAEPNASPVGRTLSRRWWLRSAGAGIVITALYVRAPQLVTGTFSDLDTFLRVVILGAALAGWIVLVGRSIHGRIGIAIRFVPVVGMAVWAIGPYLVPATTVDDEFPVVAAGPPPSNEPTASANPKALPTTVTTAPEATLTALPPVTATAESDAGSDAGSDAWSDAGSEVRTTTSAAAPPTIVTPTTATTRVESPIEQAEASVEVAHATLGLTAVGAGKKRAKLP